jgi:uracil-DNA glycosylase
MSPDYQPGTAGAFTAFVLAAPGRVELAENRPAAGQTGRNLDRILFHLNQLRPDIFPSQSRLDYVVVNAVSRVLYRAKEGRGMPTDAEVQETHNVERLRCLLPLTCGTWWR